jgi:hypothetical protein
MLTAQLQTDAPNPGIKLLISSTAPYKGPDQMDKTGNNTDAHGRNNSTGTNQRLDCDILRGTPQSPPQCFQTQRPLGTNALPDPQFIAKLNGAVD